MPTVLRWKGYSFLFYSVDGEEPPHVHIRKGRQEAKIWLADCRVEISRRIPSHELGRLQDKVREHREEFLRAWNDYFGL